jgi:hypothetical protein
MLILTPGSKLTVTIARIAWLVAVIPQTCWYNSFKFDCGLSISCVLAGGKPLDLCSGGLLWSCCVSRDKIHTSQQEPNVGALENASTYKYGYNKNCCSIIIFIVPNEASRTLFASQGLPVSMFKNSYVFTANNIVLTNYFKWHKRFTFYKRNIPNVSTRQ